MTKGLREINDADLDEALERVLVPRLSTLLDDRGHGHCIRVTDVPTALAARLSRRLRTALGDQAHVHVLGQPPEVPEDVAVTSTKLVELRNADRDGRLRPPLLAFIPPGAHASAEDSFGVATFEQASLGDVYGDLAMRLHSGVPEPLRTAIAEVFGVLDDEADAAASVGASALERARYLLTVTHNGNDPQAAGAALFELGLIPDFELFTDPAQIRTRTTRNARQIRTLHRADRSVRQRVVDLRLTEAGFRAKLAAFLVTAGLEAPRAWTRRIVIDSTNWGLSFHRWPLPEDRTAQAVNITVGELDLPRAGAQPDHAEHSILGNLTGQPYLLAGAAGNPQLSATFRVDPDPRHVNGLVAFSAQLISEESGPTGVRATVKVSTTSRRTYKVTLKRLRSAHLDDGWHYLQVLPIDVDNVPLPVAADTQASDPPLDPAAHAANESERFYVVADDDLDEPPPTPRTRKSVGITHELRRLQFTALAEGRDWRGISCRQVVWKNPSSHTLEASFAAQGMVEVPLAPLLVQLEQQILSRPETIAGLRVTSTAGRPAQILPAEPDAAPAVEPEPVAAFLQARATAFAAIRGQDNMVLAGRDLHNLREPALAYAEAYAELLTQALRQAERPASDTARQLTRLLQIDTVMVEHQHLRGDTGQLTLVAPTHPLRLLWLVTWAGLGDRWLADATDNSKDVLAEASHTLLAMRPSGFPLTVAGDNARLSVAAADLTPYWGAYLPTETDDPRTLLAEVATRFGVPDRPATEQAISPTQLADRIERYVRMHPYVQTLVICAVNPGRAEHLADTMIELERRKHLLHLTYDLRLFTPDPRQPDTGEALAELLRGEWSAVAEAEPFCTPAATGVTPKLAVSVRPLDEFRSATSEHAAHLTVLFDAFSGERLGVGASLPDAPARVHGLIQQMSVEYVDADGTVAWHKQPRHGRGRDLPAAEEYSDLLTSLPPLIAAASAAATTGEAGTGQVPRITLALTAEDSTLLHQAHRSSDWVITVDRTLGVEYFDSPGGPRHPDYIIDFAPASDEGLGHHLVVSTRSVEEMHALLAPVIDQHNLQIDHRHAGTFFDQLRLLSGRLAFKIASTTHNQRTEVLGLALARLYLKYQHVLRDQILVPLDAHLELYREARRRVDEVAESVGLHRTDLALFSLDAGRRTITCRLVEVKCHSSLNSLTEVQKVRDRIAQQLNRSASVLAQSFDPACTQPDRPDRVVRNADLAALLRPYLGRALRHGTLTPAAAAEAQWLLDHLDEGYRLEFTRTGLIFDLGGAGTSRDTENHIEFHQIGRDLVEELLNAIPTDPVLAAGQTRETLTSETLTRSELTLPRVAEAAFRSPPRSHHIPEETPRRDEPERPTAEPPPPADAEDSSRATEPTPPDPGTPTARPIPAPAPPPALERNQANQLQTPDVYLGATDPSPQYGVLGESSGRRVALDLNETHTISLFGVQGGGKSYTLGTIIEAASLATPPANQLPNPLATIVFHYSATLDYPPEFTSMIAPNNDTDQLQVLRERYGIEPAALSDIVMLTPESQLDQRRTEYPNIEIKPLKFASTELRAGHWRFLMGAVGNQSTYIRQLGRIMKANRNNLTLDVMREGIDQSRLSDPIKQLAHQRLDLAADYIDDTTRLQELIRPGRVIIVDLRDELIEKDEALGLFVVLMELFAEATADGQRFNKLVVFDEAHKYIESPDLVTGLVESVREMRHKGMSILVASQDPPSVPIPLIELSSHMILHKFNSPAWLKHLQKANAALASLTPTKMTSLTPGEAYIWSSKATDSSFTRGAIRVQLRPRVTRHGGGTKTAVEP